MIGRYSDVMSFDVILKRMLDRIPETVDKREGSVIYDALAPAASELAKAYMECDVIMDETFVDTASLQYLLLRCKERGIAVKEESAAVVQGEFIPITLTLPAGTRFNCESVNYVVTEKISDGKYKLQAETLGSAGNQYGGVLLPIQPVNGLRTAKITGVLIPGEEGDTTDSLRKKYYASVNGEAFGGNIADYIERVNQIAGVGGVHVSPCWNGGGTVKLTIISSDYSAPSEALIEKVQTAIDPETNHGQGMGLAPIGHTVTVVGVSPKSIFIQTNIVFQSGWRWEDAKSQVAEAARNYFKELAEEWKNANVLTVRIAQLESRILSLSCVLDIADTVLNGNAKNLILESDEIPVLCDIEAKS